MIRFGAPEWTEQANCADVPTSVMFPELPRGRSHAEHERAVAPARRICSACPVREPCLQYAIDHGVAYGVWGGLTAIERRRLRRQRRAA